VLPFCLYAPLRRTVQGAAETLAPLADKYRFAVVTSRQNAVRDATDAWIEKNYPGTFESVHFANHYAADGSAPRSKSDICKEIGAVALIDDSRHHALECASKGVPCVVLFGEYAWNRPSVAGAAESAGAGAASSSTLSTSATNVHLCSEWRHVKMTLDRLTRSGKLAPMPSLWVRGGMDEVSPLRLRAEKVLLKQEELAVTAVGVSIAPLLGVVAALCDSGVAEPASTVSGLDVGRSAAAGRMPRLTVTLRRTPKLFEEAEGRERAMAEQADALAAAMKSHAAKAHAEKAAAAPAAATA